MANNTEKAAAAAAKRGRSKEKFTETVGDVTYKGKIKGGFTPRKAWEKQVYKGSDGTKTKMMRMSDESGTYEVTKTKGPGGWKYTGRDIPNPNTGMKEGATIMEKKKGQKTKVTKYGSDR